MRRFKNFIEAQNKMKHNIHQKKKKKKNPKETGAEIVVS